MAMNVNRWSREITAERWKYIGPWPRPECGGDGGNSRLFVASYAAFLPLIEPGGPYSFPSIHLHTGPDPAGKYPGLPFSLIVLLENIIYHRFQ